MPPFNRIVPRLFMGFLLLVIMPLAGLFWLTNTAFEHSLKETAFARIVAIADKKTDQINTYLYERFKDSQNLASLSATRLALTELGAARIGSPRWKTGAARFQDNIRAWFEHAGYYDLLLIDAAGNVIFSVLREPDLGTNLEHGPYRKSALARVHREALALLAPQLTFVEHYAPSNDQPAFFFVTPVMSAGRPIGSVALQLDIKLLTKISTDTTGLGETGETVLAQRVGDEALFVVPLRLIDDAAFRYRTPLSKTPKPMQNALLGGHGKGLTRDYADVEVIAAWRHLPALDWGMVVKMNDDEILAPAYRLRRYGLAVLGLILLCASGAALIFGRGLVLPINRLTTVTRRLAEGDLSQRVIPAGCDEFRQLADSFNYMAVRIGQDQALLESRVAERTRELQESKSQYEELTARIPIGVYVFRIRTDGSMAFEYISSRFCEILRLTEADVLADASVAFAQAHPAEIEDFIARNHEAARVLHPFLWEGRFIINGELRWLHIESSPTLEATGDSLWNGVLIDITEQHQAVEALHISEERFRSIFENASSGIAFTDAKGNLIDFNDCFLQIFGYSREELRSMNFADFTHPDDVKVELDFFREIQEGVRNDYHIEKRYFNKSGNILWTDVNVGAIRDEQGVPVNLVKLVVDISERKQAEFELHEALTQAQRFREALDHVSAYIYIKDHCFRYVYANRPTLELFGCSIEELIGSDDTRFFPPSTVEHLRQTDSRVLTGEHTTEEINATEASGNRRVYWEVKTPIYADVERTTIWGLCGISTDITERKLAEEEIDRARQAAEAANRAKSEFLANMSHEIRTPMNAIMGLTQLVLDSELSPHQRDLLRKAYTSSKALLGILNDILDYSKIEAGRLDIESVPVIVEDVLDSVADLFVARVEEKNLELFLDIDPEVPRQVLTDPLRLTQVLNNLVGNAVKFTDHGEIHVKAEVAAKQADHLTLRFAVRDTGIGLSKDQSDRLFQAFTQADGSITRRYGGTGLGLAICDRLIGLMGGEICVSSLPGQGSTFSFTLPVIRVAGSESFRTLQGLSGLKVLVVDDQKTSCAILNELLVAWGLSVETVTSGEEALTRIATADTTGEPFDVVLLDWRMPGMDGLEVARRLERDMTSSQLIHPLLVVMVTAHAKNALLAEAGDLKLDGVLTKPVIPSRLFDILTRRQAPELESKQEPHRQFHGAHVLVAEDNEFNQQVAVEFLTKRGIAVRLASNGAEAVERVEHERFDLVLMDLHMPEMDGFEATRRIRALPTGRELPVVAMTAAVMSEDRQRCSEAGMVDFIAKPVEPDELTRVLARWLTEFADAGSVDTQPSSLVAASVPDLVGFDLAAAGARLNGDRAKLLSLLCSFAESETDTANHITTLITQGERTKAAERLHAIKGSAANLGATALARACATLERDLKRGAEPLHQREFEAAFKSTLAGIEQLKRMETVCVSTTQAAIEPDRDAIVNLAETLRPYLKEHELIPDEVLSELHALRESSGPVAEKLTQLERFIDTFNYEGALKILNQLDEH